MVLLCFLSELWFELRDARNVKRNESVDVLWGYIFA